MHNFAGTSEVGMGAPIHRQGNDVHICVCVYMYVYSTCEMYIYACADKILICMYVCIYIRMYVLSV